MTGTRSRVVSFRPQWSHDDGVEITDLVFVVRIPAAATKDPTAAPRIAPKATKMYCSTDITCCRPNRVVGSIVFFVTIGGKLLPVVTKII